MEIIKRQKTIPILKLPSHDRFSRSPGRVRQSYIPSERSTFNSSFDLLPHLGMGRVKLKIKRLENTNGRQATYAKRKHGIMKKANELSILCDIDIILLMFSPSGKPSLCKGKRSIEEVIGKFAQLTPQERAKRKLESLEALKKTFRKLDHDVNIPDFLGTGSQTMEDLTNQSRYLQSQLCEVQERLSYWTNPDKINSIEHLGQLENSLRESLDRIRTQKENLGTQQLISLECSSPFQNGMPFRMGAEQQLSSVPWIANNDSHHMVLADDPNLVPHRDVECSAGSSFGSYPGYFSAGKSSDLSNSGQENDNGLFNELNGTASLRLQMAGQYSYLPYSLDLLNDTKYQTATEINIHENHVDYQVHGSFEAPQPEYDTGPSSWASPSGHCAVTMLDEHLYSRPTSCKTKSRQGLLPVSPLVEWTHSNNPQVHNYYNCNYDN
ncbi:hypothetical protein K2173_021965 [Erythroxylum novogranatense]|uniref:MADS-box domain-containing protein n=1 Tax=Erythroxylum novogranatense TaxID=1862640 RepID=A0AAV8T2E5_9ROSI|nr:hypothetical protein K2173_021965 [Erythroxylum novogranatense]